MNIPQDSNKKKSWEHQALQISKFGVNQATTEQDTAIQNLEILPRKLPTKKKVDIYDFYQILEIFIGCILFNIGLAIT